MANYIIHCPTHQPHNWYIEYYCDQTESFGHTMDNATALEVLDMIEWKLDNYKYIRCADLWMDGQWWGDVKRNVP